MVKYLDNNSGFNTWAARQNAQNKKPRGFLGTFLWWTLLFVASWWLIGTWMAPKQAIAPADAAAPIVEDVSSLKTYEISSDDINATVQGLRISNVRLNKFAADASDNSVPVSVLDDKDNFAEVGYVSTGAITPTSTTVWTADGDAYTWRSPDGVTFRRTITTDGYVITVRDKIKNNSSRTLTVAPYARIVRTPDNTSSAGVYTGSVVGVNSDIEHNDWRQMDKNTYAYSTTNGFAGFTDQYWETVVSIASPDQTIRTKKLADNLYSADVAAGARNIVAGASDEIVTHIYAGPRDADALRAASHLIADIDDTVDYGWFWFLAQPMSWVLNALNSVVMNYGVAIIIMTLILRLLMWPLTRKSYTSMMAMQKMQPEMARIQKLYANDKMRLQMEMMRLYKTHRTSPMSGCLPMLIQIPIFFALYKALLISVQMRSAHFLWISDLAAMDPYFIMPILMGLTMWLQQRLQTANTPSSGNDMAAQTQRVMKWMPVLFTVMFAWMPAGLVLYWTVSNIFGIAQMYIIKYQSNRN